jgi:catechol 2,3-dioxygenase-like lactoylglutathione lyase family enzyme
VVIGSFPDVCVADVGRSVAFYRSLLNLDVIVDHGWYAELGIPGQTLLGLVRRDHETIPAAAQTSPRGVVVSFEVDNADNVYAAATRLGCGVLVRLASELGQRHFMVADPDGAVVDIIERVPLTNADLRRLAHYRRLHALGSATCH